MRIAIVMAALALTAAGCSADALNGGAVGAEIACETFVARDQGLKVDDLDFQHRKTSEADAPKFRVGGAASGGGKSFVYECDLTRDAEADQWKLDKLTVQ